MSPFQLRADWCYTREHLHVATTPEEVHRVLYGQLLHRMLPDRLPHGWGLAFIEFDEDRDAAEDYLERLKTEPRWFRLHAEVIEVREPVGGLLRYLVVLGPIGVDAWSRLPWENQVRSQMPKDVLFTELGMNIAITETLGGYLALPGGPWSNGGGQTAARGAL